MLRSLVHFYEVSLLIRFEGPCEYFILSSLSNYKMTTGITLKDYAKTTLTQQQQRNENELHRHTCLQRRGAPAQIAPWEISDNTIRTSYCYCYYFIIFNVGVVYTVGKLLSSTYCYSFIFVKVVNFRKTIQQKKNSFSDPRQFCGPATRDILRATRNTGRLDYLLFRQSSTIHTVLSAAFCFFVFFGLKFLLIGRQNTSYYYRLVRGIAKNVYSPSTNQPTV